MSGETFHVRVNGGREQTVTVKSGVYIYAAAAIPALLDADLPLDVEMWVPGLLSAERPFHYIVSEDDYGNIVVSHAVAGSLIRPAPSEP